MPIYTYECEGCGIDPFTLMLKIADRDLQFCARCGEKYKRLIDRPGLVWAPTAGGMR